MIAYEPKDPEYQARVRASFERQQAMKALQIEIVHLAPGAIELAMPYCEGFTQQHGYVHAGILAAALDSACGYAALSLMPAGAEVLSVEFKINLLAPAKAERFLFRSRVVKPGRTITVCDAQAVTAGPGPEKLLATMTGTMIAMSV